MFRGFGGLRISGEAFEGIIATLRGYRDFKGMYSDYYPLPLIYDTSTPQNSIFHHDIL